MAGATRGRQGRIQQLPPELKAYVDRRLREGATQRAVIDETRELLADIGEPPLSAAGLNRYATRMEAIGARIRESREIAEMWVAKFGERPTGEIGELMVELLRHLAFEASFRAAESPDDVDPELISNLALAAQRLERAAETGTKRQREIRREVASRAGTAVEDEARKRGLPPDVAAAMRAVVQGQA